MSERNKSSLIKILFLFFLLIQVQTVDITLTSSMTDTEESTYTISSNVLTLTSDGGEYTISGTCSECQIAVAKEITTTITLNSITIDNSATGPFVIKKNAVVNLILEGESTITDKETDESSSDYEGAGLKFKSSSSVTISGSGKLNVISTIKNGIKGGASADLIINGGTLKITAVNNGLASDNSVTINDGTLIITTSEGDGIKSDPDDDDTESEGIVTINGGTFNISSYNDGIQAKKKLTITGGNFNIKTYTDGSSSSNFDKDEESAKGLKCSSNETDLLLNITGGTFVLNTADDSIHSDGNISITGGTFEISSGDDAVHADQYLILGKENADNSLINLKVTKSYEGLEGAYIYIYSGTYNIIASDDGINSAGDTDEECEQGGNGNQPGGNGNQPGGQPGGGPGGFRRIENKYPRNLRGLAECYSFHMYIYGGEIYVNAEADGLDANGNIVISGGNITVWGAQSGSDGDPIDMDGSLTITGGTLLAGGNYAMTQIDRDATNSQKYISKTNSYSANKVIYIVSDDTTIRTITIPKNIQYLYYTSPNVDSSYSFSESAGSKASSNSESTSTSSSDTSSTGSSSTTSSDTSNSESTSTSSSDNSNSTNDNSTDEIFTIFSSSLKLTINVIYLIAFVIFL